MSIVLRLFGTTTKIKEIKGQAKVSKEWKRPENIVTAVTGEDLSYHQFWRWFKSAARMIIGNFEKSRVYFKAVSAIVP